MYSIPSAAAMARSRGDVMNPRTRSALAPIYAVVTVPVAFSLRGYWRTLRVRIACSPAMRMSRLTTRARTGRRMKRSVNFIGQLFSGSGFSRNGGGGRGFPPPPRLPPEPHELLAQRLPLSLLLVGDDEDRVAVGSVEHGRGRNGQDLLPDREADRRVDEHPGQELFRPVRHRRLNPD